MTATEAEGIREDFRRLDGKLDVVTRAVNDQTAVMAALASEFRAMKETQTPQIGILFRKIDALDARTGTIERDYAPRENHDSLAKDVAGKASKDDHDKLAGDVKDLRGLMWFYMGVASVIGVVLGVALTVAIPKVMG